jgi:hypothetical protein
MIQDRFICQEDNAAYYDLIGEVYFKEHHQDFDAVHKKLEDFRNYLAGKYGYDRNDYGIDIENGRIVKLWKP